MFKRSALLNLAFLISPLALGGVLGMLLPGALSNPFGFAQISVASFGIGFAAFAAAKLRNIRRGKLISFGSAAMRSREKWLYRAGYFLMVLGAVMTLVLAAAMKFKR